MQAHLVAGKVTVKTRRGNDWTRRFRPNAVAKLPVENLTGSGARILAQAGRMGIEGASTACIWLKHQRTEASKIILKFHWLETAVFEER